MDDRYIAHFHLSDNTQPQKTHHSSTLLPLLARASVFLEYNQTKATCYIWDSKKKKLLYHMKRSSQCE